jgi:hypothetical protein
MDQADAKVATIDMAKATGVALLTNIQIIIVLTITGMNSI